MWRSVKKVRRNWKITRSVESRDETIKDRVNQLEKVRSAQKIWNLNHENKTHKINQEIKERTFERTFKNKISRFSAHHRHP